MQTQEAGISEAHARTTCTPHLAPSFPLRHKAYRRPDLEKASELLRTSPNTNTHTAKMTETQTLLMQRVRSRLIAERCVMRKELWVCRENKRESGNLKKKRFPLSLITFRQGGNSTPSSQCDQTQISNSHVQHLLMRTGTSCTTAKLSKQPLRAAHANTPDKHSEGALTPWHWRKWIHGGTEGKRDGGRRERGSGSTGAQTRAVSLTPAHSRPVCPTTYKGCVCVHCLVRP